MTILDRLIYPGYRDAVDPDRGDDLGGGAADDTAGKEDKSAVVEEEILEEGEEGAGEDKAEPEPKKEITIPKARFDEAVGKARAGEKAANERADKLEADLKARTGNLDIDKIEGDIDALEDKLEEAIKDGNVEAKQRIRREIRTKNNQITDAKAAAYSQYASAVAIEQNRYDALVVSMETQHPALNPDGDDFDETVVSEIMEYKSAFEATGKSSSDSLKKAIRAVFGNGAKPEAVDDDDDDDDTKAAKAEKLAADRKAAAIKKAVATKGAQPADTKKAGADSNKGGKTGKNADVDKMSDKDFDNLSPEEHARLRGDTL